VPDAALLRDLERRERCDPLRRGRVRGQQLTPSFCSPDRASSSRWLSRNNHTTT
jgi:hypothetical protein